MAIVAISHAIKSMTYKHQIHRFKVFRQSLRIPLKQEAFDIIHIFNGSMFIRNRLLFLQTRNLYKTLIHKPI
jgi:hypothetical protein